MKFDIGNCTYLDGVTIDVAEQFQNDNPHVSVIYQGLPLEAAIERLTERASCDFDAEKRVRSRLAAGVPQGSPAHLYMAKASPTIH